MGVSALTSGRSSFTEDARRRLGLCVLFSSPEALTSDRSGPSCLGFPIPHRRTSFFRIAPSRRRRDPPSGDDAAGVIIGVICESAALADELGPGRPVVPG